MKRAGFLLLLIIVAIGFVGLSAYYGLVGDDADADDAPEDVYIPPPAIVAVIDTGIDITHDEFYDGQIVAWYDFIDGGEIPYDDNGHGTAAASLVGGQNLGAFPAVGIAVAKALDFEGVGTLDDIASAIYWAVDDAGANVISLSVSTEAILPGFLDPIEDAVAYAYEQGVLTVVAAGNGRILPAGLVAPSSSPYALVVGATYGDGTPAGFSNLYPEVMAPGVEIAVALPNNEYGIASGTSFSCPYVAGVAAELYVVAEDKSPGHIKDSILRTAEGTGTIYLFEGYGVVNSTAALNTINDEAVPDEAPSIGRRLDNAAHTISGYVRTLWTRG